MFQTFLGLQKVPSSPILRQRLDAAAQTIDVNWNELLLLESAKLIRNVQAQVSGLEAGEHRYIPLDIDVSPFDNSGTKKEWRWIFAYALQITDERLLARMDAGNDRLENLKICHAHSNVDYVIKVNLRGTQKETWLRIAEDKGME